MASGHVNRANRPNTWLHRPSLRRKKAPCQLGAALWTGPRGAGSGSMLKMLQSRGPAGLAPLCVLTLPPSDFSGRRSPWRCRLWR